MGGKFTEGDSGEGPAGGGYSGSKVVDVEKHVASSGNCKDSNSQESTDT